MNASGPTAVEPDHFRNVLGHYPTGVVVVTSLDDRDRPVGMTVGSFSSVSLDPPLVSFMPTRGSHTWSTIRARGAFCVNVLGAHQEELCRRMATAPTDERFTDVAWTPTATTGVPALAGSVAHIDCTIAEVHSGGDHDIVVGHVRELSVDTTASPLLFYRGGYGSFVPTALAAVDEDLLGQLQLVDRVRPGLEQLAADLGCECTLVSLVRGQLILTASAGPFRARTGAARVGQRVPFVPPLGGAFAAWGGHATLDAWISGLEEDCTAEDAADCRALAARIRNRGFVVALGHDSTGQLVSASEETPVVAPGHVPPRLRDAIRAVRTEYNPADLQPHHTYELEYVSAPVFDGSGKVVFALSAYGPGGTIAGQEVERLGRELCAMADRLSSRLSSRSA